MSLAGELDLLSLSELDAGLAPLVRAAGARVVIDLARLTFVDSSGLNALVGVARAIEANGGRLVLAAPTPHVERVLRLVRIQDSVAFCTTVEEALRRAERADPA